MVATFKIPLKLEKILKSLQDNGVKPILVGGCVRDYFLKIPIKDYDIELYNCNNVVKIEEILSKFGDVKLVGKSFGVLKLNIKNYEFDFSFPRIERKNSMGHKGFEVKCDGFMDYKTAFKRRDFTVNSIGYDFFENKFIDLYGGIKDLKNKLLKVVNKDSFTEDPLRVYRAIHFCARFNMKLEKKSKKLCKEIVMSDELRTVSVERVFCEFEKLFLKSNRPSKGFILLKKLKIIKYYFNEFEKLDKNRWRTFLNSIDFIAQKQDKKKLFLILCTICCNLNKSDIEIFLNKITNKKSLKKDVENFVNIYSVNTEIFFKNLSDLEIKIFAKNINIEEFCEVCQALNNENKKEIKAFKKRAKKLNVLNSALKPIITGNDLIILGIKPSKMYADILEKAYILQLQNDDLSKKDILRMIL